MIYILDLAFGLLWYIFYQDWYQRFTPKSRFKIGGWRWGIHLKKPLSPNGPPCHLHGVPLWKRVHGGRPSFGRYKRTPHPWIRKKKDGWWRTPTLEMVSL